MAETKEAAKLYPAEYLAAALIGGLIVGVLVSWLWFAADLGGKSTTTSATSSQTAESATTKANSTSSAENEEKPATSSNILVISDQPAGASVSIERAVVTESQWVVVHEDRMGQPGNALGAARFVGGVQTGSVYLLRGTIAGKKYHGLIYKDDGDRIFSMDRDIPLRDENGNPIDISFTAQ